MHTVDLAWAALAGLALIYPIWRLMPHIERSGVRDLAVLLGILGTYPGLLAIFHLTPFDLGLVYSVTTFVPALYFFTVTGYVGVRLPKIALWRHSLMTLSGVLALLALTNIWHGLFAEFESHVPGRPNHMLDDISPGFGMGAMHALALVLVLSAIVLSFVQFLRSRLRPTQVILTVLLPLLGLWSFTSSVRWSVLADAGISGFILSTSAVLLIANYALMRNHFIEVRVVTRSKLMHLLPDAMLVLSRRGRILDCNPAFARLIDEQVDGIIDRNIVAFLPELASQLGDTDGGSFELDLSKPEVPRHFHGVREPIDRSVGAGQYLVVLRDVTESELAKAALFESDRQLRAANAALTRLSATDSLTGLSNRRGLIEATEQAIAHFKRTGSRFALLSLDIDRFKAVNDRFGHTVGDQALCHVARVLEGQCRATDSLARYGGEEFIVLLGEASDDEIAKAAERFRAAVEAEPLTLDCGHTLQLTVSLGGIAHRDGMTTAELMQAADDALYEAKHLGRNQVRLV
ncbi:MAG: diguanylate cyclase [Pseudomonadota bacterium]